MKSFLQLFLSWVIISPVLSFAQANPHFERISYPLNQQVSRLRIVFDIDDSGRFWVGFDSLGIRVFNGNSWNELNSNAANFPEGRINGVEYHNNVLWVTSKIGNDCSIYKYSNNTWTVMNFPMTVNNVNKICPSRYSDKVFMCTNSGLYDPVNNLLYDSLNTNLPRNNVIDFHELDVQTFLIACRNGIVRVNNNTSVNLNLQSNQGNSLYIHGLVVTQFHGVLACTLDDGLFQYNQNSNTFQNYNLETEPCMNNFDENRLFFPYNDSTIYKIGGSPDLVMITKNSIRRQPLQDLYTETDPIIPLVIITKSKIDPTTGKAWMLSGSANDLFLSYDNSTFYVSNKFVDENHATININQVTAGVSNLGELFIDCNEYSEFSLFNYPDIPIRGKGTIWISGKDQFDKVHAIANRDRQTGIIFFPGPLDTLDASSSDAEMTKFNRNWNLSKWDIQNFLHYYSTGEVQNGSYNTHPDIISWPAHGNNNTNQSENLAPFVDVNNDGIYNPLEDGDYPLIKGDREVFSIYNDTSRAEESSAFSALGIEIHQSTYGFACNSNNFIDSLINKVIFVNFRIINRSQNDYHDVYTGIYESSQLGNGSDDYVGCKPELNVSFAYNSDAFDQNEFGTNIPIANTLVLNGPSAELQDGIDNDNNGQIDEDNERVLMSHFNAFNGSNMKMDFSIPDSMNQFAHNFLKNNFPNGSPKYYGGDGSTGNVIARHMFPSWPHESSSSAWSEEITQFDLNYRERLTSSGPFKLLSGETISMDYAFFVSNKENLSFGSPEYFLQIEEDVNKIKQWFNQQNYPSCLEWNLSISNNQSDQNLFFYPNPTNDHFRIKNFTNETHTQITVMDINGKIYNQKTLNQNAETTINCSQWPSGIYLIQVQSNQRNEFYKIVIAK